MAGKLRQVEFSDETSCISLQPEQTVMVSYSNRGQLSPQCWINYSITLAAAL